MDDKTAAGAACVDLHLLLKSFSNCCTKLSLLALIVPDDPVEADPDPVVPEDPVDPV